MNIGKAYSEYVEEQDSVLFTNKKIDQESLYIKGVWQYLLIPPLLDISLGLDHTGISISEPSDTTEQYLVTNFFANIGLTVPLYSDWINLKLVGEAYYSQMTVENKAFGLTDLRGFILYPEVELLPFGTKSMLHFSPYLKFPIFTLEDKKKEYVAGVRLKVPVGNSSNMRFPLYAYQQAIIFDISYRVLEFSDAQPGYIAVDSSLKQFIFSIGYNF